MANVLNRTTKAYFRSVNEPDYPLIDWIHDPDISAVEGWPNKYWVITGDVVTLADQATRDAIDAAELSAQRNGQANQFDNLEDVLRAFALALLDELNLHAARVNAVRDAIANASNLNDAKTAAAAVPDVPTRTIAQLKTGIRNKLGT